MKNIMHMAKQTAIDAKPNNDWLSTVASLKEKAKKARPVGANGSVQFEKLPRLDVREMKGTQEEPTILLVKALSTIRMVQTDNMEAPAPVMDVEALGCDAELTAHSKDVAGNPKEEPAKYPMKASIWASTTVIKKELIAYAGGVIADDGTVTDSGRDITGEEFIIASYGTVPSKKNKKIQVFIFKVLKP